MQLIEDNWEYIRATATAKAVEIAQHTGRAADIEDYTQEIFIHLATHAKLYDQQRGKPKTFINMIASYAKKDILRRMYRHKRRAMIDAITLEQYDSGIIDESGEDETIKDMREFIAACLQGEEQNLCRAVLIDGESIAIIAKRAHKDKFEIAEAIRQSMRPFAESIGIRMQQKSNDGEVTDAPPPAEADHIDGGRTERPGRSKNRKGTPKMTFRQSTTGEVVGISSRLSFSPVRARDF